MPAIEKLPPDIASQLHDIHVPGDVASWPFGIGWWLLAWLLVAAIIIATAIIVDFVKSRKRKGAAQVAKKALDDLWAEYKKTGNRMRFLQEASVVMRRFCLTFYRRRMVAGLVGEQWLHLLDEGLPGSPFSTGIGKAMASAPYQREAQVNIDRLYALCRKRLQAGAG